MEVWGGVSGQHAGILLDKAVVVHPLHEHGLHVLLHGQVPGPSEDVPDAAKVHARPFRDRLQQHFVEGVSAKELAAQVRHHHPPRAAGSLVVRTRRDLHELDAYTRVFQPDFNHN
eukprot:2653281-Rhodomonas_salina.5